MMKTNIAVLGAQWGDEGKGKIVDMLTPHFAAVARRGERKIGTTSRGIGPAYEDKIGRRGIRVCDLLGDRQALAEEVRENVSARNRIIRDSTLDWKPLFDQLVTDGERMRRWVGDVSLFLHRLMKDEKP